MPDLQDGIFGPETKLAVKAFQSEHGLENNGIITSDGYFKENPWEAPWLDEVLLQIFNGGYRGREDKDIVAALEKTEKYSLVDQYREQSNHLLRVKEYKL